MDGAGDPEIFEIPGNHLALLAEPGVEAVAVKLTEAMRGARGTRAASDGVGS
jgi:hypothetical protein